MQKQNLYTLRGLLSKLAYSVVAKLMIYVVLVTNPR